MSLQKDLPPPRIYDGARAIAKRNPSPCIYGKPLRLICAEERHQQTCIGELSLSHNRRDHVASRIVNANHGIVRAAAKFRVVDCVAVLQVRTLPP
jgi:hypothetical protein